MIGTSKLASPFELVTVGASLELRTCSANRTALLL